MFHRILSAVRALVHGNRMRSELTEEMAFHVDTLSEDLMRQGMSPEAARREAQRRFGATEAVHDRSRRAMDVALFDEAGRNVRFAFRSMGRSPLLTGTFVLTLALCIGFGTAVFSAVDSMLWTPLPYPDSDRLALAGLFDPAQGEAAGQVGVDGATWLRIRDEADGFDAAVYSGWVVGVNLSTDETTRFALQQRVSAGFFSTLGVAPLMGREFTAIEDVPGGPPVAVLSYGLWDETFGGDPDILGSTIRLKGELHTVVGVMPAEFRSDSDADVWTPLQPSTSGEGGGVNYTALVRLPTGMTWEEARARFAAIEPPQDSNPSGDARYGLVSLEDALASGLKLPLLVFLGAVGLMILVGCANLAGVQVSRAIAREIEMSTRQALGSGTGALIRQLVAENTILGLTGGLLGLGVALLSVHGLEGLFRTNLGVTTPMGIEGRGFAVAAGLTVAATFLFGLVPVVQARRSDALRLLVSGTRGVAGGAGRTLRKVLIVGEVAVVTVLLFAAVLLARSYGHLATLEPGFDPDGVITVQLSLDDARYAETDAVSGLMERTVEDLQALPEVTSAAVALSLPYERPLNMPVRLPGDDEGARPKLTNLVYVTPTFFETLDIPVVEGRGIEVGDRTDSPPVAVVSQAFVDMYFEGRVELGAQLDMGLGDAVELVGVVGDVQQGGAGWGSNQPIWAAPTVYVPVSQVAGPVLQQVHVWFSPSWVIRAPNASPQLVSRVSQVFETSDSELPMARTASLAEVMAEAYARTRFQAVFLLVIAGFALLLAGVGLYGIVAQEVLHRRREMGVRMALGVSPGRAVLHAGMAGVRLAAWGLVLGGVAAAAGGRVLASLAWGVSPTDPVMFVLLLGAIGGLAVVASFVPAARLARLDPALILRE
jgi:predicted permease